MSKQPSLSYKDAGVDIDAGEALVERIKGVAKRTARPEVMGGLGGFGALVRDPRRLQAAGAGFRHRRRRHQAAPGARTSTSTTPSAIDLVAMCVNDLVVRGAEPLFFLDYYATGKLNVDMAADRGHRHRRTAASWPAAR